MKPTRALPLLLACCLPVFVSAQNFNGGDDFSTDTGNWTVPTGSSVAGGAMSVSGDKLNFTHPYLSPGVTAQATYLWTANAGSLTADWQVQVDFNINMTMIAEQIGLWELNVQSTTSAANKFTVGLRWAGTEQQTSLMPQIQAYTTMDGSVISPWYVSTRASAGTATVRIAYNAATTTLMASYDGDGPTGGYAFTNLHSVNISDAASDWNMLSGESFAVDLTAFDSNNSSTATTPMPLLAGAFIADNFLASPTAVPEPATVALLAGFAVLGFVVWRRRAG